MSQETKLQLNQKITKQIEQEIKELNKELGLSNEPKKTLTNAPHSENNPVPSNASPNSTNQSQNNPNLPAFQTLRQQSQELINLLEKIIQDYQKRVDEFNVANEQAKIEGFDMGENQIKEMMDSIQHHLNIAKKNKTTLEGYASEQDYQTFLSASSETQKANLGLIEDAIRHTLKSTKENLNNSLNCAQEMLKLAEDIFKGLEENNLVDEELTKNKQEMEEGKQTLTNCQAKLNDLANLGIAEQIKIIKEVWEKLEELEKKQGGSE